MAFFAIISTSLLAPGPLVATATAMELSTESVVELLLIAAAVALATKRLRIPYTVTLTIVGIGVGFSHMLHPVLISKEIILLVFLPPLLFEGTLAMDLATLRSKWIEVFLLAFPVTFLSVAAVAFPVHWLLKLDLAYCFLLGAILAPTDPVSVIALFREAGITRKLAVIVEGESVFNDGVGVVLYLIFFGTLQGGSVTAGSGAGLFAIEVLGGFAVGFAGGYLMYRALAHIDDHLLEVMLSLVLAYGVYVASERLHVSGVVAVVAAGLIMGNYGKVFAMSPTTRLALTHFWEIMAFLANSLVFLLMGIAIESVNLWGAALKIAAIYAILTAGRIVLVHATAGILGAFGRAVPGPWRHLIAWSGLRGSVCVALALGLPAAFAQGSSTAAIPTREETLTIVSGVVLLSMLVQGLTMKAVLGRLGLTRPEEHRQKLEIEIGRKLALVAAGREFEALHAAGQVPPGMAAKLREAIARQREQVRGQVAALLAAHEDLARARREGITRALLVAARAAVEEAFRRGEIGEAAQHRVIAEIDSAIEGGEGPSFLGYEAGPGPGPAEKPAAAGPRGGTA